LGERLNGIQEVVGSIPIGSTIILLPLSLVLSPDILPAFWLGKTPQSR
jgi:hypothetical protein